MTPMSSTAPSAARPALLSRLRTATRPQHDALEAHPRLARLLDPDLTLPEYQSLLETLYGFYAPLEERLRRVAPALPFGLDDRWKTPRLARDLTALGVEGAQIDALPRCEALPVDTAAAALGCCYVLEGATLGGAIIRRHLARSLRLTPANGGAFYAGYGTRTGAMWKAFSAAVAGYPCTEAQTRQAIAAAAATFHHLRQWLDA